MTLDRHPTLLKVLDDLVAFMDAKLWGDFQISVKNGRIVHYFKTISVPVVDRNEDTKEK